MKGRSVLTFISVVVIFAEALLLFLLRSVPAGKIWNGYTVVYTDAAFPESSVVSRLKDAGCDEIISAGAQRTPFRPHFLQVLPARFNSYPASRAGYFTDYSKNFSLYYVPDGNASRVAVALRRLSTETGMQAGIDRGTRYPFFALCICVLVFLLFCFFSEHTVPFCVSCIFPVLLVFSKPFYPVSSAVILYMLLFYLSLRLWKRKGALQLLIKSPYVILPLLASFIVISLCGWQEAVLAVSSFAASIGALFLVNQFEIFSASKSPFKVAKIFSASQIPLMSKRTFYHTLLCILPLAALLLSFILTAEFAPRAGAGISLPAPVESGEAGDLPSFNDFYEWTWNLEALPYRNLNREAVYADVNEGDSIYIPEFEERDGMIFEVETEYLKYDDSFRLSVNAVIESLDYGAIEKVLQSQGTSYSVSYSPVGAGSPRQDFFSLILVLICLFVPVALSLLYIIKGRGKLSMKAS